MVPLCGYRKAEADTNTPSEKRRWILVFIALLLFVPVLGLIIVKIHTPQLEREAFANLEAIAQLKSTQIENWLAERQGNSEVLAANHAFARDVEQFKRHQDTQRQAAITHHLSTLQKTVVV